MTRKVEIRNYLRELHQFQGRLAISSSLILFLFLILLGRFFYLQVLENEHYHTLAEANRISISPIVPNRGLILDRNGEILAQNYSTYTLELMPSKLINVEAAINELATIIPIEEIDRRRFKKLMKESNKFESLPIRTRLSEEEVARFTANSYRFPDVELKARLFRQYPKGKSTSHVLGYISRINRNDLTKLKANKELANYKGTNHIGRIGIEQSYEKELHGVAGFEKIETDSEGRKIRVLSRTPPISGNDLTLTIDAKLQEIAENAFGDQRGALVAIDPNNGDVLAFVSKPGFDSNLFVNGIDFKNWRRLNSSIDRPLNNRALHGVYPPGSTFKPFMALAGLELKLRTPGYTINDPGYFQLPNSNSQYRDWKAGGHGKVDVHKSLVVSCDTYYYELANELGIDNISSFIGKFGLGKKTGIDIPGEASGLLPSREWKMNRHKQKWWPGDTISVGIGQGYNLATPLQLAFATSIIANKGTAFRPHLVKRIQSSKSGEIFEKTPQILYQLNLNPKNLQIIRNALIDVTKPGGTAAAAGAGTRYTFAGKTGTSQVIGIKQGEKYDEDTINERHRDHALFIGYAPAKKPSIALSVLIENVHGGSAAAPIARQVMDYALLGKLPDMKKEISVDINIEDSHD
ncbi:MAG: penicillin-binding protein 2 [Nitrosomonadaceae bacterium]|nr:penicillin-binding protein 2 [Nitrosomonadaceae bacterium]|tara:strand:+ start:6314 stop:8218 length:1905 start_codon:yes stop_codon:yes gene_type:complete